MNNPIIHNELLELELPGIGGLLGNSSVLGDHSATSSPLVFLCETKCSVQAMDVKK